MIERRNRTQQGIEQYLQVQGLGTGSRAVAKVTWDYVLPWKVQVKHKPEDAEYIFTFAFGFRWNHSQYGAREPGPVNQALTDQVNQYYKHKPRHIYA